MIDVSEYETQLVPWAGPPPRDAHRLAEELDGRLELLWLADGRLRVAARAWVGVVRVGDHTIRVLPKLAGEDLDVLTMLGVVAGAPLAAVERLDREVQLAPDGGLVDLLCLLLCREAGSVLAAGPVRDYREHRDDLAVLRGRLELLRQTSALFGRVDVLACEYEEFDHDVLENRLLREGLGVALSVSSRPDIRAQAAALFDEFSVTAPGSCPSPDDARRTLQYDRRNEHYRAGHVWALALLEAQRLSDPFTVGGENAFVFLLDMNRLFEAFVEWVLKKCLKPAGVRVTPQYRDASLLWRGSSSWGAVRPDALLSRGTGVMAVDAKYKRYDLKRVAAGDLYQLFLYAQAYPGLGDAGPPAALLVYPTDGNSEDAAIDLRVQGTTEARVHCLGIRLPALLEQLRLGESGPWSGELAERLLHVIDPSSADAHQG